MPQALEQSITDQLKQAVRLEFPLDAPITLVKVKAPDIDLLGFIKKQPFTLKGFWSPPYCQDIVWMGFIAASAELSEEFIGSLPENGRIYGGMRFSPGEQIASEWELFGKAVFVVPRFEKRGGELLCYLKKEESLEKVLKEIDKIDWSCDSLFSPEKKTFREPFFEDWAAKIEKVKQSSFEKLVLVKRTEVEAEESFCPWAVLQKIKKEESFSWSFVIDGTAFVGASPERLFNREGVSVFSEAVAGTRPTSSEPLLDVALREELLHSEKDIREHAFVTNYIESQMHTFCEQVRMGSLNTLSGAGVQHLQRRFSGILKEGVTDKDIIKALHPTPAVGGLPKEGSCEKIREIEGFDRGWYAGTIGWVQKDSSEFAVGIRSCLIRGKKLYWYSGCGIVKESDSQQEWEEAELKAKPFIRAL